MSRKKMHFSGGWQYRTLCGQHALVTTHDAKQVTCKKCLAAHDKRSAGLENLPPPPVITPELARELAEEGIRTAEAFRKKWKEGSRCDCCYCRDKRGC